MSKFLKKLGSTVIVFQICRQEHISVLLYIVKQENFEEDFEREVLIFTLGLFSHVVWIRFNWHGWNSYTGYPMYGSDIKITSDLVSLLGKSSGYKEQKKRRKSGK